MILKVDGIKFSYNGRRVLDHVEFKVDKGELLTILGPNGVGKTTLLRCINAILKPAKGAVMLENKNVLQLSSMEIAGLIGYVAQKQVSGRLTAFDTILMGRRPHIRWRVTKEDLRMVDGAIKSLNLESLAMRYIDQMSGGELQKVAVGRALVQEPKLLLLDEPTSNLDLKNQIEILDLIRRVVREHDVCAIMTMHNLNMALRFADKYLFLKNGRIHAVGETKTVAARTIKEVYDVSVEVLSHGGYPVVVPSQGLEEREI
jgi:iron complex transport system ATP-binding protein